MNGLNNLTSVGERMSGDDHQGHVRIRGNHRLPTSSALALVVRLLGNGFSGQVMVEDNLVETRKMVLTG